MNADEIAQLTRDTLAAALKEEDDKRKAEAEAAATRQKELDEAVGAALKAQAREFAKSRRLPTNDAGQPQSAGASSPYVTQFADVRKYDNLNLEDQAFLCGVLDAAKRDGRSQNGISEAACKALAIKIAEDKSKFGDEARRDLKAAGLDPAEVTNAAKSAELNYTTQAGFGDEWIGVEYSRRLWESIRAGTFVTQRLTTVEIPEGTESMNIPVEADDPVWYKVGQTTAINGTTGIPDATVTTSKVGTAKQSIGATKMGARVSYAEEMNEDSLIPWAGQLRTKIERSGSENLEAILIDGDTDGSATTNINDIAGTPAGNENFLVLNGFRKLALVTNTANKRSASGMFLDTDFKDTVKLMGVAGLNGADVTKTSFIIDANVNWACFDLASVKTRDVFTNATLENGMLKGIWGYPVDVSYFMHAAYDIKSSPRKVNTAGKVDQDTTANNTTGTILAVRWDQWLLGFKRRMTIKIQDLPASDSSQIVAFLRVDLVYRDVEASALSYNVKV